MSVIVIDIGKTLSKVSLWSESGTMLDRQLRTNEAHEVAGIRRLDSTGIGEWLIEALTRYSDEPVETIVPVGHGAGVVAVTAEGAVIPPLDYEQPIPAHVVSQYRTERDTFRVTGSPALPDGLNMGAQLFWMEQLNPAGMAGATLLPWAQYWSWLLTGRAVSEVTSLGCHTDLWQPELAQFSPLAVKRGWSKHFAPLRSADQPVGTIRSEIAERTGLSPRTQVYTGLHDSNAALLAARAFPEIAGQDATVLSTGTWFVAMRLASERTQFPKLSEERDCLINVDPYGRAVPSARFMGGREIETIIEFDTRRVDIKPDQPCLLAAVPELLAKGVAMMPTLAPGCGPFPNGIAGWNREPENWYERRAAICLYAALVADASLSLIGSRECLLVEGRFAEAEVFVRALAALRPDTRVFTANVHNDVSFGALRLLDPNLPPEGELARVEPLGGDLARYRERWQSEMGAYA